MKLSLRLRLTLWYCCLLLFALGVFVSVVLWLQWAMLVRQMDENLAAISAMAVGVTADELTEHADLPAAAHVAREALRSAHDVVAVLDATGQPVGAERDLPLAPDQLRRLATPGAHTVTDHAGRQWRAHVRSSGVAGQSWLAVVAEPMDDLRSQWTLLLRATAMGLPLAVIIAAVGGLWLGRTGLAPLSAMAAQAHEITARTPSARLTVPRGRDELTALAHAFNHVLGRLGSALEEQRRFMADASHEVRTPLSVMRTAADVTLTRHDRSPAEYREALETVAQQSARLARLVDDMFVLARADANGYRPLHGDVDLSAVARDCVADLRAAAERRRVPIIVSAPAPAFVHGDEMLLRRLMLNLIQNGVAYNREGGALAVDIRTVEDAQEIRVADHGFGIPADAHERIFERFVRLDPARAAGGAGLGLSIARWIAEVHAGTLTIETSSTAGTVFLLRLPAARAAAMTA